MYGAVIGDIAGSRFEFDNGGLTKDFELFTKRDEFTDDSVMTVAVADALMQTGADADDDTIRNALISAMKKWGKRYPYAGYGGRFFRWVLGNDTKPYNSYGNGSAMRVSRAGWMCDTLEKTRHIAKLTADVTHNHPEGIKGAECTRAVMFMTRKGYTKDEMKEYVTKEFGYDISAPLDEMRKRHHHEETCMDSLPKALISFFEGNSYEDVIRNAISLGGDTDTLAAIAGAMGEAMYGVPENLKKQADEYLTADLIDILSRFENYVK